MRLLLCKILILFFGFDCMSQDPYFSQFSYSPLIINPAFTGYINCELRASSNYRNQWSGLTTPFITQLISVDARFRSGLFTRDRDWFGLGSYVYSFAAGDANLQKIKSSLLTSYNLGFNRDNSTFLSGGLSIGFVQRSIDFSKLQFEDQFDGDGFSGQTVENIQNESLTYFDISAGIALTFQLRDRYHQPKLQSKIGISIDHINKPNESFFGFYENEIDQVINLHTGFFGPVGNHMLLNFEIWHSNKLLTFNNGILSLGANLLHPVNDYFTVYGGLWYRLTQSFIPMFGFEMSNWRFMVSYDISISSLQPGESFEFSLVKTFCFNKQHSKCLPCPSFGSDVNMFRR
jgi:type IX secretion system PorP/SprF family membrane protein